MKKFLLAFLLAISAFALIGCGGDKESFTIALITDKGDIDDKSFNQASWEGVVEYATEYGIPHRYYKPTKATTEAYVAAIDLAVANGAKIIVTPGYLFEEPVNITQKKYPNVKFVLLDGNPANVNAYDDDLTNNGTLEENTYSVFFAEEQVGFLAGYAAVKDGMTKLGFMGGMAVPAVVKYGQGFILGAEAAAIELDVNVTLSYHYTGDFIASPEVQAVAASMFTSGAQVVFAAGGAVGQSVMAAAEAANKKVIGVDVDQSGDSETVITSAMKNLKHAVILALYAYFGGTWDEDCGGVVSTLDASNDGVGFPMATSKFTTFSQAMYDALMAQLAANEIDIPFDLALSGKEDEFVLTKTVVTMVE
ncbi:MAG: BMP family ABC transporter substrate-binding protein [Bacilli bacterium]